MNDNNSKSQQWANQAAWRAINRTSDWILQFGGRLAGTQASRRAADAILADLQQYCPTARLEPFTTHPGAFTGFYRIDALLYLVGVILLLLGQSLAAGFILLFMATAAGLEFGWYTEFYDWLYPSAACQNVSLTLDPRGEVRQQLILSAHHDSAPELRFLHHHQKLYGLKIILPDSIRMLAFVTAWAWTGWSVVVGGYPPFALPALIILVVGIYPVFTKFFLFGPGVSPGAGDNLIASAMLLELLQDFIDPQDPQHSTLENTRLILVSFDAEESGLRGSRAWVKAHKTELCALPTYALNIDSIYNQKDLQFLISDLNSHIRLDEELAEICIRIANQTGFQAQKAVMRFGGGATDAAELARAGVRSTTMLAMPTGLIRDGLVYHTMQDTVGAIEPGAVEACLVVAQRLACELDRKIL